MPHLGYWRCTCGDFHLSVLKMSEAFLGNMHPIYRFGISNNPSNQIQERPFHINTDGERSTHVESFTCWQKEGVLLNFGKSRHLLVAKFSQILPDYFLHRVLGRGRTLEVTGFDNAFSLASVTVNNLQKSPGSFFPRISWLCLNFIACKFPTLVLISHWTVYATWLLFLELLRNYFS